MEWLKEHWSAFSAAAGPRRYFLGTLISVVIGLSDHIWAWLGNTSTTNLLGIPSWTIGLLLALVLIVHWLLEYVVQLRKRMRGARYELAELLRIGVGLRNSGRSITDRQTFDKWKKQTDEWDKKVIEDIKKLNEADAMWFSILDVVPPPRLAIENTSETDLQLSAEHYKAYREHDFRLRRLGEMLYELWER